MIANNCMEKSEKIDEKEIIAKKLVMLFQDDFILKLHVDRFYDYKIGLKRKILLFENIYRFLSFFEKIGTTIVQFERLIKGS